MNSDSSHQNAKRRFWVYHFPFIGYGIIVIILSVIPKLPTPPLEFHAFDKLAHLVEYGLFAVLAFRSFSHLGQGITTNRAFLLSALFLSLYALLNEIVQYFVPGRHSDVYDLIADLLGAFLVLIFLRQRRLKTVAPR
jgi:VanZ family protein